MAARRTTLFQSGLRLFATKDKKGCRSAGAATLTPGAVLLVVGNVLLDIRTMARDESQIPEDPTPIVASPTDVAALTHKAPKPLHERTAHEEADVIDWAALASSDRFRNLIRAKRRFIVPAMIFFVVYYFALPVLIGYARPFMETRVWGPVNLAYLFALSQFFMAWIIAALYVRAAARFDRMAKDVTGIE
jgi:uncharacterized membrane protein (DUF485 family)